MKSGETLMDVLVTVTDRLNTMSGTLTDTRGVPSVDGSIIVFAADSQYWGVGSRRVRSARPDQRGRYEFRGLPAGEYLAVAVDYVEQNAWNDPDYLAAIRHIGRAITLAELGEHILDLTVQTVP